MPTVPDQHPPRPRAGLGVWATAAPGAAVTVTAVVWLFSNWSWERVAPRLVPVLAEATVAALVFVAWLVLYASGRVSSATSAGLRLVSFALAAHALTLLLAALDGLYDPELPLIWLVPTRRLAWLVRNLAMFAYGLGLGLVVFSSAIDLRRRRSAPAWTRPAE